MPMTLVQSLVLWAWNFSESISGNLCIFFLGLLCRIVSLPALTSFFSPTPHLLYIFPTVFKMWAFLILSFSGSQRCHWCFGHIHLGVLFCFGGVGESNCTSPVYHPWNPEPQRGSVMWMVRPSNLSVSSCSGRLASKVYRIKLHN